MKRRPIGGEREMVVFCHLVEVVVSCFSSTLRRFKNKIKSKTSLFPRNVHVRVSLPLPLPLLPSESENKS